MVSALKFRNFWAPIAAPPRQIGDGYHYSLLLRKFDNLVRQKTEAFQKASMPLVAMTQLAGIALNWIPYVIGSRFFGRKVGLVIVRFFNRFWLFLLAVLLSAELIKYLESEAHLLLGVLAFFVTFLLSPFGSRASICFQFLNPRHLYDQESYNEMTRVYATETSTPALLGSLLVGLAVVDLGDPTLAGLVSAALTLFLAFVYPPALVAFLLFDVVILASAGMIWGAVLTSGVGVACMAILRVVLKLDPMSAPLIFDSLKVGTKELSVSSEGLRLFARMLFLQLAGFALLFWSGGIDETKFFWVFFATLTPASFLLFSGTYLGRIWGRAWEPIWSLFVATVVLEAIHSQLNVSSIALGVIALLIFIFLSTYFFRQARFVVSAKAQFVDVTSFMSFQEIESGSHEILSPDDPSIALYFSLYSEKVSALENYSVQPFGYRKHLFFFIACLRRAGWTKQKTLNVLTSEVSLADWVMERPINPEDSLWETAFNHTMQYWATNREYNLDLVRDGLYLPTEGWSESYSRLVAQMWDSAGIQDEDGKL